MGEVLKMNNVKILFLFFISSINIIFSSQFVRQTADKRNIIQPTHRYDESCERIKQHKCSPCVLPFFFAGVLPDQVCNLIKNFMNDDIKDYHNVVTFEGPPGTGKTTLAQALAVHTNAIFLKENASDFNQKYYGVTEERIRALFKKAQDESKAKRVVIFIDEIDSIALGSSGANHGEAKVFVQSIVNQLKTSVSECIESSPNLIVIFATNNYQLLELAFKSRVLRITLPVPHSVEDYQSIFEFHLGSCDSHELQEDLPELAEKAKAASLSGRDITTAVRQAKSEAQNAFAAKVPVNVLEKYLDEEVEKKK